MGKIGFEFPVDEAGTWNGISDPSMEHFTGSRLQHLGREVPQNTLDARLDPKLPARIAVSVRKIETSKLPGIEDLRLAVKRCQRSEVNVADDKGRKFLEAAEKLFSGRDLNVLQIRDFNTTGVQGPCEVGKPFFAMLKATGQSQKGDTATGSYGIGKYAPFAVSELRTVFVSTVWLDPDGKHHHYVQGKAVLMSHLDEKGRTHQGTGFWGERERCLPVQKVTDHVPDWLRLQDTDGNLEGQRGTMLSIVGFAATKGWQHTLAAYIAENFFGAIHRGDLEVAIEGGFNINTHTLDAVLADPEVMASVDETPSQAARFKNVASYLTALRGGDEVHLHVSEQGPHLGKCELPSWLVRTFPNEWPCFAMAC